MTDVAKGQKSIAAGERHDENNALPQLAKQRSRKQGKESWSKAVSVQIGLRRHSSMLAVASSVGMQEWRVFWSCTFALTLVSHFLVSLLFAPSSERKSESCIVRAEPPGYTSITGSTSRTQEKQSTRKHVANGCSPNRKRQHANNKTGRKRYRSAEPGGRTTGAERERGMEAAVAPLSLSFPTM